MGDCFIFDSRLLTSNEVYFKTGKLLRVKKLKLKVVGTNYGVGHHYVDNQTQSYYTEVSKHLNIPKYHSIYIYNVFAQVEKETFCNFLKKVGNF